MSTDVGIDPARAFEIFTTDTEAWFAPGPASAGVGPRSVRFEPRSGGAVYDVAADGSRRSVGRVLAWERTPRLVFSLDLAGSTPTEVEVRFEAIGAGAGTRVSLEHRGWGSAIVTAGDPDLAPYVDRWRLLLASFESRALDDVLMAFASVFRDAVSAGDAAFLDRHMTDDAMLVFPGERYAKPEVVATIGDHPPYEDVHFADPHVVRLGPDSAILTCRVTGWIRGTRFGNVESSAYVRSEGRWRLAFLQSTPLPAGQEDQP